MASSEKIICPVCSSGASFSLRKNGFDLYRCSACWLLFVYPLPLETAYIYESDYFAGAKGGFGYVDYDQDKAAMKNVFLNYLRNIEKTIGGKGSLFDIGAATGYFLDLARQDGWSVSGVEISDYAADIARKKGLDVQTGIIAGIETDNKFDVVTMWDVIEHVRDPIHDLHRINHLLRVGGVLAINTPNSGSLTARILGSRWHLLVPPEHLYYFNPSSIKKALELTGFRLVAVKYPGKIFTLEYIFHTLARWQKLWLWKNILSFLEKNPRLGRLGVPINLRDNMLIYAVKI